LAIEPIAARYVCFPCFEAARMIHSEKLSKSKPFGIYVFGNSASFSLPMDARIVDRRRSKPCSHA
jgi:hypothetical protein